MDGERGGRAKRKRDSGHLTKKKSAAFSTSFNSNMTEEKKNLTDRQTSMETNNFVKNKNVSTEAQKRRKIHETSS